MLVFTWWAIWFNRNKSIFYEQQFREKEVMELIIQCVSEWDNVDKINIIELGIDKSVRRSRREYKNKTECVEKDESKVVPFGEKSNKTKF